MTQYSRIYKFVMLIIVVALCSSGCSTVDKTSIAPHQSPYLPKSNTNALQEHKRIVLLDYNSRWRLRIVRHAIERDQNNLLIVKLGIENAKNKNDVVDIQTIFKDKDGFELEQTNWEPVLLHRRKVTDYTITSMTSNAVDYTVLVRKSQ